ncbi:MAG: sigma-70 family RNA polymerase sigma factor [Verrucomicrobiales bacterium]|nr:sigma-70 family RNA polymerase sigma factor [Verrucomicrobiales bacterium]
MLPFHGNERDGAAKAQGNLFPPTRWSLILDAQDDDPEALAGFCQTYWFPLYSYARRLNLSPSDAEDLTQSFFERLLSRDVLGAARAERGKLRNFLLSSFANFAREDWRRLKAQKRGGRHKILELDALTAEERFALEPRGSVTPQVEYERAWARELLRQAVDKLEAQYESNGSRSVFQALRDHLSDGSSTRCYKEIAAQLGLTEGATRFAAFKLRQRYRSILREIVAETVTSQEEVEKELTYLRGLFED